MMMGGRGTCYHRLDGTNLLSIGICKYSLPIHMNRLHSSGPPNRVIPHTLFIRIQRHFDVRVDTLV